MKRVVKAITVAMTALAATSAFGAEKLVIAGRDGAFAQALKIAQDVFKAQNPGLDVEVLELPGGGLLEKFTLAMREKSSAYDVVMVDDPWAPEFMSKGWLANLDAMGASILTMRKPPERLSLPGRQRAALCCPDGR